MLSRIITDPVSGNRVFEIDGKQYLPAAFRSFRPTPANVSLFYRNGVRLFQMQCCGINSSLGLPYSNYGGAWVGEGQYDFSPLDRQIAMFRKYAPEGYFMVMFVLDMPEWYRKSHPDARYSYDHFGEACLDEAWLSAASDYLQAALRYTEEHYGDIVFGYSFSAGGSTEWFDSQLSDADSASERKTQAYRDWLGDPAASVPTKDVLFNADAPHLADSRDPLYTYLKFCNEQPGRIIARFAQKAQEVLHHRKIVGLFFGYTDCPKYWQNRTVTTDYEAVWANPDIDMLFSPAAYGWNRLPEGSSSYQYTVDSIGLHGKLYLHEIDHRTHLADYPLDNYGSLGTVYQNDAETIRVLRREFCAAAVKGGSFWWFDFMGGYYASPALEEELRLEMQLFERLNRVKRSSVSEIAVFVDPVSFLHMKDSTTLTVDCVCHNRDSLHQCGAPYDYFNLNDLPAVNIGQYKMFVFLNALDIKAEVRAFIKEHLREKTKVWVYAPDRYSGDFAELSGISLTERDSGDSTVLYKDTSFSFGDPISPLFVPDATDAHVLASYKDGSPACVRRGNQYYLAVGNIPAQLWHDIARASGVHLYTAANGSLYVDSRFAARQTMEEQDIRITFPFDCVLEELFDGGTYHTENRVLSYHAEHGETKLFLITERNGKEEDPAL